MTHEHHAPNLAESKIELSGSHARCRFADAEVDLDFGVPVAHFPIDSESNRIAFLCGESHEQQASLGRPRHAFFDSLPRGEPSLRSPGQPTTD